MLGKLGDWRLPLGPYTPPQLIIASVGAFVLIKTATLWAPVLGPIPVVVWAVSIWAARHSRVGGRSLGPAVIDALSLAMAPRSGRIGGRAVTSVRGSRLTGGFGIEEALDDSEPVATPLPLPASARRADPAARPQASAARAPKPSRPTPGRPAKAAQRRGRGPKAGPAAAPAMGPAPTALELLLAEAASRTSTQQIDTTKAGNRR